ncbi:MAG: hypothetical protein ACR2NA_05635 [Solirubrobacterales bacterium]
MIAELEGELGETVSQRIAARYLGMSHTALGRRVRGGEVPLVENREGRTEVPVPALLRLAREPNGAKRPASGRPAVSPRANEPRARADHAGARERSLAYHRAVAERLRREDVHDAHYRVRKWRAAGKLGPYYADSWEEILQRPLPQIRDALTEDSQAAADLRQNSPFAGTLSEPERRAVIGLAGP